MKRPSRRGWPNQLAAQAREMLDRAPRCCDGKGYVYVVQWNDLVKIGRSLDRLEDRLKGLQASCPVKLELVALGRGARWEKMFHGWFDGSRQHGEWFTASTVFRWMRKWREDHCLCCEMTTRPVDVDPRAMSASARRAMVAP